MASPCITTEEFIRVFVGTWNVAGRSPLGSLAVDLDEWLNLKDVAEIYVLGFQEIVPLNTGTVIGIEDATSSTQWTALISETLNNKKFTWMNIPSHIYNQMVATPTRNHHHHYSHHCHKSHEKAINTADVLNGSNDYVRIVSRKMVGLFISVWVKRELLRKYYVSEARVCAVGCGVMGYLGNKGSVSVSFRIEGTSFCFIVAHLASGERKGDEARRNYQVSKILQRTVFAHQAGDEFHHPKAIFGHELFIDDALTRELINKQDWRALKSFDQLKQEQGEDGVFQGWREGDIEFAPTYKYSSSNSNHYSGSLPSRTGEKQRTPAWCDRIMWYGKGIKQLSYCRSESKFSDHRPVSAMFSAQIEVVRYTNSVNAARASVSSDNQNPSNHHHQQAHPSPSFKLPSLGMTRPLEKLSHPLQVETEELFLTVLDAAPRI
ncbi:Type I inositol 1,4,5-trisphosphate 5-phosphatase CVP2 [Acorus calamus]|uniref:Type I inositol 1,4,5-trisphosphate 5-phosphatase CVP2 n=1 Tax=Acorus calamus TaxID=4465 RepID=A0AAV9D6Z3_ACOCL|nr:Type I inositol 1,4,5-trisphosphate 5-phosphatase CVP2 [Acorus calamus]